MLERYFEEAKRAFYWNSFSPEVRARQIIASYEPEYQSMPDECKERYIVHFLRWLNARSRTASPMVTGPAKFPTARNQKALNAEQNVYEKWRKFVERAGREIVRTLSPEDDLEAQMKKHSMALAAHEKMVLINKAIRSGKDVEKKIREILPKIDEKRLDELVNGFGPWNRKGFDTFELSNSRQNIKAMEERIIALKNRIYTKSVFQKIDFPGGCIDIIDDRVCVIHEKKPEQVAITALKSHGFHWSPKNKYWCRKHTAAALSTAKELFLV